MHRKVKKRRFTAVSLLAGVMYVYNWFLVIHDQEVLKNKEITVLVVNNKQDIKILSHYLSTTYPQSVDKLCKVCE